MEIFRFVVALTAAVLVLAHVFAIRIQAGVLLGQTKSPAKQSDNWVLETSFGVPVQVASGTGPIEKPYKARVMFVFIEDRYCSPDLLRAVLTALAGQYASPDSLRIDVYSDREMLRRALVRYKWPASDFVFPDTPEGEEMEKKVYGDVYIPKTGWARARYYRGSQDGERLLYKSSPDKVEMIEVVLKPKLVGEPRAGLRGRFGVRRAICNFSVFSCRVAAGCTSRDLKSKAGCVTSSPEAITTNSSLDRTMTTTGFCSCWLTKRLSSFPSLCILLDAQSHPL